MIENDAASRTTRTAHITAGPIRYVECGAGPTLVFLHGVLMDGSVWDPVIDRLRFEYRCIVPTLPLGGHSRPMKPDADLRLPGFGPMVNDLLDALDVHDVTLIGNDHAAILAAAVQPSDRVSRLVITSCEAFENFPPGWAGKGLRLSAVMPGGLQAMAALLRVRWIRRLPLTYGWLSKRGLSDALMDGWLAPLQSDPGVRRDLRRYAASARRSQMVGLCRRLAAVEVPTLVVWTPQDRLQRPEHGERLTALIPGSRLELVDDSFTLIMQDQPERLASLIEDFVGAPIEQRTTRCPGVTTTPTAPVQDRGSEVTASSVATRTGSVLGRRLMAAVATGAALGLAAAHLVVTLDRFPTGGSGWRLLGVVLLPAVSAALLAAAAVSTLRSRQASRAVRIGVVMGAVVMWALAVLMAIASIVTRTPALLQPDGPGLWAIVGAPAFTALAWRTRAL